jgi:hypothetical protein
MQTFATKNGLIDEIVVRAVKLISTINSYPDIYVVFHSGKIELKNYDVKGDLELTKYENNAYKHIIQKYWYESGETTMFSDQNEERVAEIHTNTITPEENLELRTDWTHDGWKPRNLDNKFSDVFMYNFRSITQNGVTTNNQPKNWIKFKVYDNGKEVAGKSAPTPPFNINNVDVDFIFKVTDANKKAYACIGSNIPTGFDIRVAKTAQTVTHRDGSTIIYPVGKMLQAKKESDRDIDANWQNICYIDEWDLKNFTALNEMRIALIWGSDYAKALLNFKPHTQLKALDKNGKDSVFHATVAIDAVVKSDGKALVYKASDEAEPLYCKLELEHNTFDVRFIRPISLATGKIEFIDAHADNNVTIQREPLSKLANSFKDWRNQWKTQVGDGIDYQTYYAPVGSDKFVVTIKDQDGNEMRPGQNLGDNELITTDLNGKEEKLYLVSRDLMMRLSADGNYIEYQNLSSTVNEFHVWIPVGVEYYWGTYYDKVEITVKRTLNNSRKN